MTSSEGSHDVEAGPVRRAGLSRAMAMLDADRGAVLAGLLLATFSVGLAGSGWAAAIPAALSHPRAMRSLLAGPAAYAAIMAGSALLFGWLVDGRSRRQTTLGALGAFVLGACLVGASELVGPGRPSMVTPGVVVASRVFEGIGAAGIVMVAFVVTAELDPPMDRGRPLGLVVGAWLLGALLGPLVAGLPRLGAALRPALLGQALALALGVVAFVVLLLRMPTLMPIREAGPVPDRASHRGTAAARRAVRNANLAAFLFGAVAVSVIAGLPVFLVEGRGLPVATVRLLLVPYGVSTAFAALAVGWIVSRIEHLRDLALFTGFVLVGGCLFLSRMTTHVEVWRVSLYLLMAGVGVGSALVLLPLAVQNASPVQAVGRATSVTLCLFAAGGVLGAGSTMVLLESLWPPSVGVSAGDVADPYGALAERVDSVVHSADTVAIRALARTPELPERVTIQLGEFVAAGATFADSAEATRVATRLADEVRSKGEQEEAAAGKAVRDAYRQAMHRVFATMLAVTIGALLFLFRMPEMALRRTSDRLLPRIGVLEPIDNAPE